MTESWVPIPAAAWPDIADAMTKPWPRWAVRFDLRWWADRERMGRAKRPGRPTLCKRWGWGDRAARNVMAAVEEWADPRHGDPNPDKGKVRDIAQGPTGVQPGSNVGPARVQESARKCAETQGPGSSEGPAVVQRGSSEGPHARNTQAQAQGTGTEEQQQPTQQPLPEPEPPAADASAVSPEPLPGWLDKPKAAHRPKAAWLKANGGKLALWDACAEVVEAVQGSVRRNSMATTGRQILTLLAALEWPPLDEWRADALLLADAFKRCPDFENDVRGVRADGQRWGKDRSQDVPTFVVQKHWESRVATAYRWRDSGQQRARTPPKADTAASATEADRAWRQLLANLNSHGLTAIDNAPPRIKAAVSAAGGLRAITSATHDIERERHRKAFVAAYQEAA